MTITQLAEAAVQQAHGRTPCLVRYRDVGLVFEVEEEKADLVVIEFNPTVNRNRDRAKLQLSEGTR